MRNGLIAALGLSLAALGVGPAAAQGSPAPRLIVVVSVDQFSADLFTQYRPYFTRGLRRLSGGAAFPSGYQSHAATETCPGHSTLLTGSRPSRTGIIANNWYDQSTARADKAIYCAEDERVPGSNSRTYTVSPFHLRVPTLGDLMRRANPRSRSYAVAGKDRAAVMMGGHNPNGAWWWNGTAFVGNAGASSPAALTRVNGQVSRGLARPRAATRPRALCAARARDTPIEGGGPAVGAGGFARDAGDATAWRASPDFDASVLAIADGLRREMRLGEGPAPDLLAVGLSAADYVGHSTGTQGAEMCEHLMTLDGLLGRFFAGLDRDGIDYAVVLSADHGGLDIPERVRAEGGLAAARSDPALDVPTMGRAIGARLGLRGPILLGTGSFGDVYVDRALSAADRRRAQDAAIAAYRAHAQVAAVLTREEILASPPPSGPPESWSLLERARASTDAERSGDFLVFLRPWITPIADTSRGYVATHGSAWDYDRRVPILFWRRGMTGFEQPLSVETADIMPTLAALIGLPIEPGSIDGHCLDLIAGPATSCATSR